MTESKTYTTYKFIGIELTRCKGKEIYRMSLADSFKRLFTTSFDRTMEDFYKRNYSYETESKTLEEIYNDVRAGIVFIPFSKTIDKNEVISYLRAGLEVRFMRTKDYNTMKKDYISFM
jgi:hypothetical protein